MDGAARKIEEGGKNGKIVWYILLSPTPRTPLVGRVGTTFEWCLKKRFEVGYFRERPASGESQGGDKPSPTSIQFNKRTDA